MVDYVLVERLQDISEEQAVSEGTPMHDKYGVPYSSAREGFMALWDRINFESGHGWDTNPWVWTVGFRRI